MNWDEKAEDYAGAHHTYEHRTEGENLFGAAMFVKGANWQRDELRTDEAVERVADWMCHEDHGYTLDEHDGWCQDPSCDLVESYRQSARAAITALIGDTP